MIERLNELVYYFGATNSAMCSVSTKLLTSTQRKQREKALILLWNVVIQFVGKHLAAAYLESSMYPIIKFLPIPR